jgi:hypothetical protein
MNQVTIKAEDYRQPRTQPQTSGETLDAVSNLVTQTLPQNLVLKMIWMTIKPKEYW